VQCGVGNQMRSYRCFTLLRLLRFVSLETWVSVLAFSCYAKKNIYIISRLSVTNIFWVLYCSIWKVSLCVQWMDKWEKYLWEMESWAKSNGILRFSASMDRVFIEIHVIEHIYWAHHYMCLCAQRPLIGSLIPHRYIYIGVQYLSLWHLILSLTS
jgi:hypothetical protein